MWTRKVALYCVVAVSIASCRGQRPVATWVPDKGPGTITRSLFLTDDLLVFERCSNDSICRATLLKIDDGRLQEVVNGIIGEIAHVDSHSLFVWDFGNPQHYSFKRIDAASLET